MSAGSLSTPRRVRPGLARRLGTLLGCCLAMAALGGQPAAPGPRQYFFDFGPPGSALELGYRPVDASHMYSEDRGYGWVGPAPEEFRTEKPAIQRSKWYHFDPHYFFDEMVTPLRVDGVRSSQGLAFRLDLPPGRYRAVVTLGDLDRPLYGMDVYANGRQAAGGVQARHWLSSERGRLHYASGYYKRVRFDLEVADKGLLLELGGDDSEFRRLLKEEQARDPDQYPKSRFRHDPLPPEHLPFADIGGPFSGVSLMGLEVFPRADPPLELRPDTQRLEVSSGWAGEERLPEAARAFNAGDFAAAEKLFLQVADPLARGIGLLALAGRPEYEREMENATDALSALKQASGSGSGAVKELADSAAVFLNALKLFADRGNPQGNGLRSIWRAVAELDQTQPGDPTWFKSRLLQGRFMLMLDPHQWSWHGQEGFRRLREVERVFPNHRLVRFYLHGDLTGWPGWQTRDYAADLAGAPQWAVGLYAAYNLLVDFSEWWAQNKQAEDGSVGGGWGDDVELVGFFGYIGRLSEGASPLSIEAARKLVTGVYEKSGHMDRVGGFFYGAADSEHSAEWTGKTLPMMLAVDYGNPLWAERALQTGKLMSEIWMGVNSRGHFHWRSNFLGGGGIGPPATHLDSGINWRAAEPAVEILRQTGHPVIRDMMLRHAQALWEDAMRTDKGKPRGIIPGDIDFETDELGGRGVPTWYDPGDVPARRMYGFQQFHQYRLAVLELAYDLTGEDRYLEPIRLEAEYARQHGGDLKGELWKLKAGSPEWIALAMKAAVPLWEALQPPGGAQAPDRRSHTTAQVAQATVPHLPEIRRNWPYVTTEIQATDRVYIPNAVKVLQFLTGAVPADWAGVVSYRHVGRRFAAALLGSGGGDLTLAVYLPGEPGRSTRRIGIIPWTLHPGRSYSVRWGEDRDGDDRIDGTAQQHQFLLDERGGSIDLDLKTDTTYIVQIQAGRRSGPVELLPDLAIGPSDVEFHRDRRYLYVSVHNIGSAAAGEYELVVRTADGREFSAVGSRLSAPLDFTPQRTRFGFPWEAPPGVYGVEVELRSRRNEAEITRLNNRLKVEIEVPAEGSGPETALP